MPNIHIVRFLDTGSSPIEVDQSYLPVLYDILCMSIDMYCVCPITCNSWQTITYIYIYISLYYILEKRLY